MNAAMTRSKRHTISNALLTLSLVALLRCNFSVVFRRFRDCKGFSFAFRAGIQLDKVAAHAGPFNTLLAVFEIVLLITLVVIIINVVHRAFLPC